MRWRVILLVSLAANLVLAIGWMAKARHDASRLAAAIESSNATSLVIKTNVQVRRQFFAWQEIESSDYRRFIQNFRDISCPEPKIRDIITADRNAPFSRRRAADIGK